MADTPHVVHSCAEAYLFLLVSPCGSCGESGHKSCPPCSDDDMSRSCNRCADVRCGACGAVSQERFQLPETAEKKERTTRATINPTGEPSKVIDAAQWMSLSALLIESASSAQDTGHARQLRIEAGECIAEALKFYNDDENDLPPPEAFFHEPSRTRFRNYPGEFSRQRLINKKAALPKATDAPSVGVHVEPVGIKRWWVQRDQSK